MSTVYPNTLSQSSESNTKFREFTDLNNVKNSNSTYAISKSTASGIASKSGTHNRPSTITAKNFQCNIPAGSKITKITCEYATCYTGNISIAGPTVDLLDVNVAAKKGKALTKTMTKTTLSWTGNFTVASVNSSSFGVKINYPANTKSDVGKVKVQYIRLIITYSAPNFTLSSQKVSGTYTDDEFTVKLTCNNKGQTSGGTNVKITLPSGVSYVRKSSGDGSISTSSGLVWNTGIGSKLSATIQFVVKITTDGNHSISFKETSTSHTASLSIKTSQAPPTDDDEGTTGETPAGGGGDLTGGSGTTISTLRLKQNSYNYEENLHFTYNFSSIPDYMADYSFMLLSDKNKLTFMNNTVPGHDAFIPRYYDEYTYDELLELGGKIDIVVSPRSGALGLDKILFLATDDEDEYIFAEVPVEIIPDEENLTVPHMSILKLTSEELNRLGDGITYNVTSWLKLVTSEEYVRDWYKNFRIGVCNGEITSENSYVTNEDIFKNAEYWSDPLTNVNTFEQLTCEFTYDEDYPVYVIFTGDYPEGDPTNSYIQFTNPTIKENETADNQCIFPIPIRNINLDDGSLSNLSLNPFESSNSVLLFDLDAEDIETTENTSILGFQLNVTLDTSDTVIMLAKLINQNGASHERSIQITNTSENRIVSLGGSYDLWGFSIGDLVKLDEWKVELMFSNPFSGESESIVTIENVELVFYVNKIQNHLVKCFVNGEDTRHYGMFLQDEDVPTGLKTNVKYLDIDGSDKNEAYNQTIDKKEISLDFRIVGCTIEETTAKLLMLGKLFTNDRDEFGKPIPNKLELTNYPGIYWNVIMESPIDNTTKNSNYEGTIKLVVPDGTAYAIEETVTSFVGYVDSIAKINPVITLIPESNNLTINELKSEQTMVIHYDENFIDGDVLQVESANRKLILKRFSEDLKDYELIDISQAIDWHSDFFLIRGEYHFECDNGLIQTVSFTERW